MSISLKTHKRLWNRAGQTCAYPGCDQLLMIPTEAQDDDVIVGKECHIVARGDDGPRSPKALTKEEKKDYAHLIADRDGYANFILMCGVHHDMIDTDVSAWTVERLVTLKKTQERTVAEGTPRQQIVEDQIEVRYAAIVDEWARAIDIDAWDGRMSRLVANGLIEEDVFDALEPLRMWLLNRVWPGTLPELEAAFTNFRLIAEDLEAVVSRFCTRRNGFVFVDRVHKEVWGPDFKQENVEFLERRAEYYGDLAADLTIELTRAVNLICDRVRETLWPAYRLDEGYATVGLGMNMHLSCTTYRALYPRDAPAMPYPGLKRFITERPERDLHYGSGFPGPGVGLPGISEGDFPEEEI